MNRPRRTRGKPHSKKGAWHEVNAAGTGGLARRVRRAAKRATTHSNRLAAEYNDARLVKLRQARIKAAAKGMAK